MGQAPVPTTIEPTNTQPYLLEPLALMELPEAKYDLELLEPMKFEENKVTIAPREMAEETTEATNEEEPTPLLGTLEGIDTEEILQVDL